MLLLNLYPSSTREKVREEVRGGRREEEGRGKRAGEQREKRYDEREEEKGWGGRGLGFGRGRRRERKRDEECEMTKYKIYGKGDNITTPESLCLFRPRPASLIPPSCTQT